MKAMIALLVATFTCVASANNSMDIIVKFKKGAGIQDTPVSRLITDEQVLIPSMNIQLIKPNSKVDSHQILEELRMNPMVEYAQYDHPVTMRKVKYEEQGPSASPIPKAAPNDPSFMSQWSMGESGPGNWGIGALEAWLKFGSGGKTVMDHEIVSAVVDGGMEHTHSDLKDNLWTNVQEIAGNGVDDDGNGYIDDIHGWNGYNNSGNLQSSGHGTHVAGIIGAKGNNENQVVGVNWDLKIMNIPGSSGNTSVILRAYGYILAQRQLWNETKGEKGAYVVSTNSSFGVDYANCAAGSYPAWNDIYEEMGQAGIISAAATANNNVNIDEVGDVPTGCSSDYIMAVTNNQQNGKKARAGYGVKAIDLAAPGTQILSTWTGDTTRRATGTSMATPHVAGAVAFLHSVASMPLTEMLQADPAAGALEIKRILMESVTPNENFMGITVTGGVLNLYKAAEMASKYGMSDHFMQN